VSGEWSTDTTHHSPLTTHQPKITDFGLARRLDGHTRLTLTGTVVGTPSYMAPEQADPKRRIGPTADVWALGAILYECLTGRPPFVGESPTQTMLQVLYSDPIPPRRLQPGVPRDLELICLKCLEKDPKKRHASASALADELRRFLHGEPIRSRSARWWEVAWKRARRHPAAAGLLLGLLAMAVVGFPGVTALWLNAEAQRAAKEQERDRAAAGQVALEHAVYAGRIVLAQHAYLNNDIAVAQGLLDEAAPEEGRPDLRDWEWRYLRRQCSVDLYPGMGHALPDWNWVHALAAFPDGRRVASAAGLSGGYTDARGRSWAQVPGELKVWDLETGRCLRTRTDHAGAVSAVAVSPDGRTLASGSADGGVRLLDLKTGRRLPGMPALGTRWIEALAFSPDGRLLAVGGTDGFLLWDVAAGKPRLTEPGTRGWFNPRLAFRPDGRLLLAAWATRGDVWAWDPKTGKRIELHLPALPIYSLAFSPDLPLLAVGRDHDIEIWDADGSHMLRRVAGFGHEVDQLAFGPGGVLAAGGDDRGIRLCDARNGLELMVLRGHAAGVSALTFAPGGRRLVSGDKAQTIKVWDVSHDPQAVRFHAPDFGALGDHVNALAFADGGRELRVAVHFNERNFRIGAWNAVSGAATSQRDLGMQSSGPPFWGFVFSPDGRRLAVAEPERRGILRIIDASTGAVVAKVHARRQRGSAGAFSADGSRFAYQAWSLPPAGAKDGQVQAELTVVECDGPRDCFHLDLPPGLVISSLTLSSDGRTVAGALHSARVRDGRVLMDEARGVNVWDVATGRETAHLRDATPAAVMSLALRGEGDRLAGVMQDGTLEVWDLPTGADAFPTRQVGAALYSVKFSPNGRRLAVTGQDSHVRLYDAFRGAALLDLVASRSPGSGHYGFTPRVVFSPDGRRLAANGWDGQVSIWSAPDPE
jgi:WD40 repeat protein